MALTAWLTNATQSRAEVLIGLAAPTAGREQPAGDVMRQVAQKAVTELNAKGGVLGEMIALVIIDDQCTDAGAVAAATAFVQKQVKLVIGHPCARAALAAAQIYGPAGILFIAPATRHPALTDKRAGKTIFRLSGRDDQQAATAAQWLMAQSGTGPFAVVHDKTAYSRGLAAGVAASLATKAQPPALDFPITAGENVYAPVIAKLREVKPRAVFFAGYPAEADIIVTALRTNDLSVPVLGSDSLATVEFTTQRAASDPSVQVLTRFQALQTADTQAGDASMILATTLATSVSGATWSPALKAHALHTAQAIYSWAEAARRASSLAAEKIAPLLANPVNEADSGSVAFNEKGDARVVSFYVVRWSGKEWIAQSPCCVPNQ